MSSSAKNSGPSGQTLRSLLTKWKVSTNSIKDFLKEEVTVESLQVLSDEAIARLIPKEGPRASFLNHLKLYKEQNQTATSSHHVSDEEEADTETTSTRKRKRKNQSDVLHLSEVQEAPQINSLHAYLKTSVPGTIVLAYHKSHGHLDDYNRDLLCQQAIYMELQPDYNIRIERGRFSTLADYITAIFPSESKETWYDVVKKRNSSVVYGRLRHKYYAVRRGLVDALLIPNRKLLEDLDDIGNVFDDDDELGEDALDANYQFLLENAEPWPEVEEKWNVTRARRLRKLSSLSQNEDYLLLFPCLRKPLGYELIALDGEHRESSLKDSFKDRWRDYSKFLITVIRQYDEDFLSDDNISDDEAFVRIILEIPNLFKVRTLPKSPEASKSAKCWRPSTEEVKNAFCLRVTAVSQIQEKIDNRSKVLKTYKFPLTPVPVIVGSVTKIRQSFVVLGNTKWEVDSPWTAVFGTFKMCFGLQSMYSVEARHIFVFLQRTLMQFQTAHDFQKDKGLKSHLAGRLKDYELFIANPK